MNNAVDNTVDPYLELPLDGIHLIEASAGTGKTFTLATLFTRLVVEKQLRIGQILAVTFTEAATQELRKRIRLRLQLAARLLQGDEKSAGNPEEMLTLSILQNHVDNSGESVVSLQRRLQQAADEVDLAAIFTIHGFCARVLREHALESGQTFAAPELLGSERELLEIIATDLWRSHAANEAKLRVMLSLWNEPQALARDLRVLLSGSLLAPLATPQAPADDGTDPVAAVEQAAAQLRAVADAVALEKLATQLATAFEKKVFDGRRAKLPSFLKAQTTLKKGLGSGRWSWADGDHLAKLLPSALLEYAKAGQEDNVPRSPVLDALQQLHRAEGALQRWLRGQAWQMLNAVRDEAARRLLQLKRERRVQGYDDLINGVAAVFEPCTSDDPAEVERAARRAEELALRLRAQYAIALVDEFQDTDDRQWQIFQYVFGNPQGEGATAPALFLIGDPKQAIYGFRGGDVNTYLAAAQKADKAPALDRNFRSRPGVLSAIEQLYANANAVSGGHAFVVQGIDFHRVHPGTKRTDSDYTMDGKPAAALTLRVVTDQPENGKAFNAEPSRQMATDACVANIHAVLSAGQAGSALIDGKPVQPGDIAVLVRKHSEATRIQQALAAVGIPAVAAGKQSLFASQEAKDLQVLLQALLQPGDEGRLRALLATVLLGESAASIAALEHEGERQRGYQLQLLQWRERWLKAGTLALVSDLCALQGERLLALFDGERRLTNYLQLAELLQQADARALGLHGLVDWLGQRIAGADPDDEAQLLRLESDARRVQIVTLHKSKGLEYPLVFLPYVGIGSKASVPDRHCVVFEKAESEDKNGGRVLHWKLDKDDPAWPRAVGIHAIEEAAEDARLLYVGLTRAEHALWLVTGAFYGAAGTHLGKMLGDLPALERTGVVDVHASLLEARPPMLRFAAGAAVAPARTVTRSVPHDWWVYSFTQLAHAEAGNDSAAASTEAAAGAGDEPVDNREEEPAAPAAEAAPWDPRFSGSRFGNVLHDALEHTDFNAWRGWQAGQPAPSDGQTAIAAALRGEGYIDADLKDGIPFVTGLVGQTLTVPLPEGGCLAELGEFERRAEIEFHFAMAPTSVPALLQLLHLHEISTGRSGFGLRRQLEGLMTGKIDLTYTRDGRWYVLDYKSNRLQDYRKSRLEQAMRHSEYDLQALIYTVALHRWLRFRLGDAYEYARDFGGIRYLFCRGLDATDASSPGVYAHGYPQALVDGLDRLFAGGQAGHAALLERLGARA